MSTFVKLIDGLGSRVAAEMRRANADPRQLPEIAESALVDFDDLDGVELESLADLLESTSLPQQPRNPFSDLPLTVFRSRDFYIEMLVWSHATTAIHQHGFSGAFRVVRGSSIHTRFGFEPKRWINDACLLGDLSPLGSEGLAVGCVRQIAPGMDGLIHSLYHLDNPSISLIVRTGGHSAFGPQYSYYPPALALARKALEADELIGMFLRLLDLTRKADRGVFCKTWYERIAQFEFPRLAWLYLRYHDQFEDEEREIFRQRAEAVHGELVGHLFAAVAQYANQLLLVRMRERVYDPELRFFLALLMNVPDRADLLRMVSERFPDRDPIDCCADWLGRLSVDEHSAVERMKEVAQMIESKGKGALQFSRKLRRALPPGADSTQARSVFDWFIRGSGAGSAQHNSATVDSVQQAAFLALEEMPQLAALRPVAPDRARN